MCVSIVSRAGSPSTNYGVSKEGKKGESKISPAVLNSVKNRLKTRKPDLKSQAVFAGRFWRMGALSSAMAYGQGFENKISRESCLRRMGLLLLPHGWDASPSLGYSQHLMGRLYTLSKIRHSNPVTQDRSIPRAAHLIFENRASLFSCWARQLKNAVYLRMLN